MISILKVLLLLNVVLRVEAKIEESWLSVYGEKDHGRPLSEGVNIGMMNVIQCSLKCNEDSSCRAVQFDGSQGRMGSCYIFTTLTHNGAMIPAPGHKYFEQRECMDLLSFDAMVVFPEASTMILFSGDRVLYFNLVSESGTVNVKWANMATLSQIFPSITTFPVQAAFPGITSEQLYILAGGQMYCFQNLIPGFILVFSPSTPADVLAPFLSTHTGDITDIVPVNADRTMLHLMDGDTFYKLQWNAGTSKYDNIGSFSRFDTAELWSGIPDYVTSLATSIDNANYFVTEGSKLYFYSPSQKLIKSILVFCDV